MYASIITTKLKSEQIDRATETLREILTSASPEGWQHTYLVVDHQSGQLMSFGVWNSEAEAVAYETSGRFQQDAQKMQAFMESAPERRTGEIILKIQP
jgi:quinol monooxygenase YgiN